MFNRKLKSYNELKQYAYGHDFGQSETCGVLLAGRTQSRVMIPSVWSSSTWGEIANMAASSGNEIKGYLQENHFHLKYVAGHGETIDEVYGQKVFDDRMPVSDSRGDMERYWRNVYSLKALMVGSASLCPDKEYALHVVTGVPVELFSAEIREKVESALKGTYTFRLNDQDRSMVVKSVRLIAEGAGALIAYGKNNGRDEGIIDIGGETTDLYGARNQQPITQMRAGRPRGVGHAFDLFNRKFRDEYGRQLDLNTCRTLFVQHINKQNYSTVRDSSKHDVKRQDIARLITDSLRTIGQDIAGFVESSWKSCGEIEQALLVGGGAYYFREYIVDRLPYVQVVKDPEYANALGYATLAGAILVKLSVQQPTNASEEMAG